MQENTFASSRRDFTLRKQVRFDTPSKSDPRLDDVQIPKPFTATAPLTATKPLQSIENFYDAYGQPNTFNGNGGIASLSKTTIPKPSDELELSIFDSSIENRHNQNNSPYNPRNLFQHELSAKDIPYRTLPEKFPFCEPNARSQDDIFGKKDNSEDSIENNSFFTIPNSKSQILEKYKGKYNGNSVNKFNTDVNNPECHTNYDHVNENVLHESEKYVEKLPRNTFNGRFNGCICKLNACSKSDQLNYNPSIPAVNSDIRNENKYKAIDNIHEKEDAVNEYQPSISDLYDLIRMQVQQLQILQQRVDRLSNMKHSRCELNRNKIPNYMKLLENEMITVQKTNTNIVKDDPKEKIQQISIGVMTSFEITVSSNKGNLETCHKSQNDYIDEGVQTSNYLLNKRVDIHEENGHLNNNDIKMMNFLDGIERYDEENSKNDISIKTTGPVTSTKVIDANSNSMENMNNIGCIEQIETMEPFIDNFNNSDDECSQPGIGWTFYNRVIGHVNKILRTPPEHLEDLDAKKNSKQKYSVLKMNQMEYNKRETNTFSKKVTFDFQETKTSKQSSDTSLHMNKLAMKYLNDETSRLANKNHIITQKKFNNYHTDDMSLSTIQYMQRHNLLSAPGINKYVDTRPPLLQNYYRPIYGEPSKILDITALKRQPKLLGTSIIPNERNEKYKRQSSEIQKTG